jgi:fructokinase
MVSRINEIAAASPYGFTVSIITLEKVTAGISVAYFATQDSFNDEGIAKCLAHASENAGYVGGWLDDESGRYYFDSIRIFTDLEAAKSWGREQNQLAIYDITNNEVHNL